jgi:shikimate dehydrogenase
VLGKPVAHSLSPLIHTAGYAALGLAGWTYTAIECDERRLADLVAGLDARWAGLSLTMPLKEIALAVADTVDPRAAALGAANTLVRGADGSWHAVNTDTPGMVTALEWAGVVSADRIAVLGAGGTARAALGAAAALGAPVTLFARRSSAIAALRPVAEDLGVELTGADWADAAACVTADIVISTVPRGVADHLATAAWRPGSVFFDVLYDPWPTPAAQAAAGRGSTVVSGLELLLAQAAGQFELFTGATAPVAAMRQALAEASNSAAGAMWIR